MATAESFFTDEQINKIMQAVKEAERKTSGEIRVHIESKVEEGEVMDRAANVFAILELHRTRLRNGVLFYLAIEDKKFAILGDSGINAVVPENFWDNIKETMLSHFRKGEFTEGMIKGITLAGDKLLEKFPYMRDDVNELPDEVSFA
jgi:uncharacterized membrane protein